MATKVIQFDIPFQKLISVIEQLDPAEKLILKKKLESQKITTWQARFGKALLVTGKRNARCTEQAVADDVKTAIAEVRRAGVKH